MKNVIIALMCGVMSACSTQGQQGNEMTSDDQRWVQTKRLSLPDVEQAKRESLTMLLPTKQRLEHGRVNLTIFAPLLRPSEQAEWREWLTSELNLPVEIDWKSSQGNSVELDIVVELDKETCRYQPEKTVSDAYCRHLKRQQMALFAPERYRNGIDLIVKESGLEVGAIERLHRGTVRIAENPDQITEGSGGQGGE